MRGIVRRLSIATVFVALATADATAQAGRTPDRSVDMPGLLDALYFGGAVGASIPSGDFGNNFNTGLHLVGLAQYVSFGQPFSVRGEVEYNQFSATNTSATSAKLADAALSVIVRPRAVIQFVPYAIGGFGLYRIGSQVCLSYQGGCASNTWKPGINVGVGLETAVMGAIAFGEIRFHHVSTSGGSTSYAPVAVGIMF